MSLENLKTALQPNGPLAAMAAYRHFCVYELVPSETRPGKTDKMPCVPRSWKDPAGHLTAEQAFEAAASWKGAHPIGVGYLIWEDDPFFFLDLDQAREGKAWKPHVEELRRLIPKSAFEISSSRTGCHMFGSFEGGVKHAKKYAPLGLELYTSARLAALTGESMIGNAGEPLTEGLKKLIDKYFEPGEDARHVEIEWEDVAHPEWNGIADDDELIERFLNSRASPAQILGSKATNRELWEADEAALAEAFPTLSESPWDRSGADMSLASRMAYWTGSNPVRMLRLMERSALQREKWDMRPSWLIRTIEKAIAGCTAFYGSSKLEPVREVEWTTEPVGEFATHVAPSDKIAALVQNPESAFTQAWNRGDHAKVMRTLAWLYSSNCEKVLEGVLLMGGVADSDELREQIKVTCASLDSWAGHPRGLDLKEYNVVKLEGQYSYGAAEQLELFDRCVYVLRENMVLAPNGELYDQASFNAYMPAGVFSLDAGTKVTTKPWDAFVHSQWLRHPRADAVVFRPDLPTGALIEEEGQTLVNYYVPVNMKRVAGDVTPFLAHLELMLEDDSDREHLISYLAAIVQYPGKKFRWAPLIQGAEGNGKGFVVSTVQSAVGYRYTHLVQSSDIGNKFNDWIIGKLLIVVNEMNTNGNVDLIDIMKPMITDDFMAVQGKGTKQGTARVYGNFLMTTNRMGALGKAIEGRRYAVFRCRQQSEADVRRDMGGDYFLRLNKWLESGGQEAVNDYLAAFPIKAEMDPTKLCIRAPRTTAYGQALEAARGSVEDSILEAIAEGRQGFREPFVSSHFLREMLQKLRKESQVPPRKWRELMQSIGYDWHPSMLNGRCTKAVSPDGAKSVLYVKLGHPIMELKDASTVVQRYMQSQMQVDEKFA